MTSSSGIRQVAHDLNVDRTEDIKIEEDITFDGLLLSKNTVEGLTKCGFLKPSPIQLKAIPLGKCGFDLIVEAKSGTGKTAVFSVIALESIQLDIGCQCIVVAPTREIAVQIQQVISLLGVAYEGLSVELAMGGTNFAEDTERLGRSKYQILIGTPGRLKHLIKEKIIHTDTVRLFVLDEADRLMEPSFKSDINYIYSLLPERKQVVVASATYTPELQEFLSQYMRSPSHINPYNTRILLGVSQHVSVVKAHFNKVRQNQIILDELKRILSNVEFKQCLIFCNYQATTSNTWKHLCANGWPAEYLCSSQNQENRLKSLSKLQSFECRILVATDLASRGLDAANVDLVINLETPYDLATYLHRIGRCGRYGSKGNSVTILPANKENEFMSLLQKYDESFDIKPITSLIDNEMKNHKVEDDIKIVEKSETIDIDMDMMPLFKHDKTAVDEILNSLNQDSVDRLLDPSNDFGLEDYYSTLMGTDAQDVIPEMDYINHLKNTVPEFGKITKYIETMFYNDDNDTVMDANDNIVNVEMNDNTTTSEDKSFSIYTTFTKSVNRNNSRRSKVKNTQAKTSKHMSHGVLESSSSRRHGHEEYVAGDLDDRFLVANDDEEYWKWRERLSAMTAYIQQNVYLQTLSMLNDMDMNEP